MKRKVIFLSFALTILLLNGCGQKTAKISEEEAKQIVLTQVTGATMQDIYELKTDYDDGTFKYEGKIYYEQKEYEFEIDGYTGTILEWDAEPINNHIS